LLRTFIIVHFSSTNIPACLPPACHASISTIIDGANAMLDVDDAMLC
jgi:hypothetical protein